MMPDRYRQTDESNLTTALCVASRGKNVYIGVQGLSGKLK